MQLLTCGTAAVVVDGVAKAYPASCGDNVIAD
jgi:hypothetical protein